MPMRDHDDISVPTGIWQMLLYELDDAAAREWVDLPFVQLDGRSARDVFSGPDEPALEDVAYLVQDICNHYLGMTTDRLFTEEEIIEQWHAQRHDNTAAHAQPTRRHLKKSKASPQIVPTDDVGV